MKRYLYIILSFILTACGTTSSNKNEGKVQSNKIDTTTIPEDNSSAEDTIDYNDATYFIVVADTGLDYYLLQKKMITLHRELNKPIETMGRIYNKTKDLIEFPDNSKDEIYAGDYFPRRYPSENLSLEYLSFYQKQAGDKTIALVAGIYKTEKKADSALTVLQKTETEKKAFEIKAEIFVGCMH